MVPEILLSAYLGKVPSLRLGFLICGMAMGSLGDGDAWMWCLHGCTERSPAWRGAASHREDQRSDSLAHILGTPFRIHRRLSQLVTPGEWFGACRGRRESTAGTAGELGEDHAALDQRQVLVWWDFFFRATKTLNETALRGFGFLPLRLHAEAATQLVGFTCAL